ncbi:AraC family transcriptional regulator [Actinokineospora sp. NBRC 105648]|uniref:helix-turn-helix domain-containing protein n=1 Tax=Actinokineospora sp. NBRC 105648 TaxID=3032206 RepID=UPI0024A0F399|nr:AraC family transcriptional regulator [Actinokineospora sp. NBRC 105648]GLZ43018.1 AraC family transcriptional regulator [Actinokineospora sp. NBRC 105648]
MTYRERRPSGDHRAGVACVWSRESALMTRTRVVPDACVDLIWHRETGALVVAGPDTGPHIAAGAGTLVGLRFRPGETALGLPVDELRDARVALSAVWSSQAAQELADKLAETSDIQAAQQVLLDSVPTVGDPVAATVRSLAAGSARVRDMADTLGWSERQLHRRCLAAFGYGPKVLHRVLRFQQALRTARTGVPPAEVAALAGFTDQSHLAREVRALAGVPLSDLR